MKNILLYLCAIISLIVVPINLYGYNSNYSLGFKIYPGDKEYYVTDFSPKDYDGYVIIPNVYSNNNYPVTQIRGGAFADCCNIKGVSIGSNITVIAPNAFTKCKSLESIIIPSNVDHIGSMSSYNDRPKPAYAFNNCENLNYIYIYRTGQFSNTNKNSASGYVDYAYNFVSGDKNTTVYYASTDCNVTTAGPTKRFVPGAFEIKEDRDYFKTSFSLIPYPEYPNRKVIKVLDNDQELSCKEGVYTIEGMNPDNSKSLTAYIYDEVTKKDSIVTFSVKTLSLDIDLDNTKRTQTTLKFKVRCPNISTQKVTEYGIFVNNKLYPADNKGDIELTNLRVDYSYDVQSYIIINGTTYFSTITSFRTLPIVLSLTGTSTPTTIDCKVDVQAGDATILKTEWNWASDSKGNHLLLTGLEPNKEYNIGYTVYTSTYDKSLVVRTIKTESLLLASQQPKVISTGNVIVAAESNIADNEKNIGFEWRRTDWNNDFDSNKGQAYIYGGKMEGYIRNMNAEKLWKYRPYYYSNSGKYYYGDWIGIDPSNTSYFEPTVHTYDNITVNGNVATVNGYSLRGTDAVRSQGFQYWKDTNSSNVSQNRALHTQSNATIIEAEGVVMTAVLSNLDYSSTYSVRSFVSTDEGTFYGETRTFSTGSNTTGIENVVSIPNKVNNTTKGIYDISGRKLPALQHGINIVISEDGTRRKIYKK